MNTPENTVIINLAIIIIYKNICSQEIEVVTKTLSHSYYLLVG